MLLDQERRGRLAIRRGMWMGGTFLLLIFGTVAATTWPTGAVTLERQSDSGIIANPGDDWSALGPIAGAVDPEFVVGWFRGDDVLSIHSVPNDLCELRGNDGRTSMSLVATAAGLQYVQDVDGVSLYESDAKVGGVMSVFEGPDRSFAIVLTSTSIPTDKLATELTRITDLQISEAGGVVAPRTKRSSRLDGLILTTYSVPGGVARGAEVDLDTFDCVAGRNTPVLQFLHDNTTERTFLFTSATLDAAVVVSAADYPYELFASAAAGTRFSPEQFGATHVDGLDQLKDARAWTPVNAPTQVLIRLRRGRILLDVSAFAGTRAQASQLALAFALAQEKVLPRGASSAYVFPTPIRSAFNSAGLVGLVGAGTLGVQRLRAGRSTKRAVPMPPPLAPETVVNVDDVATGLRLHGRILSWVQVVAVAIVIIGVAAEIGWWRWVVGGAGFMLGLVATILGRRHEDNLLGHNSKRARPAISVPAALVLIGSVGVLLLGGSILIVGLRDVLFKPSLSHLQRADRLGIEPRRLAWIMFAIGVVLLFVGALLSRGARALARIGWGRGEREGETVVYLRSFHDDNLRLPATLSARRPFVEWFNVRGREHFEESIAWELSVIGSVIAIGRPNSSRATLGAAREHFSDADWQQAIAERLAEASVIAVTIGETHGLAWELTHLVSNSYLSKSMFLIPPTSSEDASSRWTFTRAALVAAGAPLAGLQDLPPGALIVLTGSTASVAFVSEQRDEAAYRAAVAMATDAFET